MESGEDASERRVRLKLANEREKQRERERERKNGSAGMVIANNKIYFAGLLNPAAE